MPQLIFGTKEQIQFNSDSEFFEALGFLTKNDGTTSLNWENNENQGAWGSEGRIHCYKNIVSFPSYFSNAFSSGRGKIQKRINCNEFLGYIINNYNFSLGKIQDQGLILSTVPPIYVNDFLRGSNL